MSIPSQTRLQIDFLSKREGQLRPPASPQSIADCELKLGRFFPASYKEFLLCHNGWENYDDRLHLFGTSDYSSPKMNNLFLNLVRGFSGAVEFEGYKSIGLNSFSLFSIYKFLDGKIDCSNEVQREFKIFSAKFQEYDDWLFWPRLTLLGIDEPNDIVMVAMGSEKILEIRSEGVTSSYESFYEWISSEYDFVMEKELEDEDSEE